MIIYQILKAERAQKLKKDFSMNSKGINVPDDVNILEGITELKSKVG